MHKLVIKGPLRAAATMAATCALLAGCAGHSLETRRETANAIAQAARMESRVIQAGIFDLAAWQRLEKAGAPARVYIEGDGYAWVTKYQVSRNPTPLNPLALRLAAQDGADNVVYLARPCQYGGSARDLPCGDIYWTQGRTAPEVVEAYQKALDRIKTENGVTGFELVGYSGGAAVAALVAAERDDILSLRTVAGNLDYAAFTRVHGTTPMTSSLAPENVAGRLASLPQMHFTGGQDKIVPPEIFGSWKRAAGGSPCVGGTRLPGHTHDKGWVEAWPALLALPPKCGGE